MPRTKAVSRVELELVTEYLLATLQRIRGRIADGPVTLGQVDIYCERALTMARQYGIEDRRMTDDGNDGPFSVRPAG